MSRHEKLIKRFLSKHNNFTFQELKRLLQGFGYTKISTGRTSGSRVAFINRITKHMIRLHRPHPEKILRRYQLDYIEGELKNMGAVQ